MERQWRLMFMQPDLRACEHEGHRSRRQGSCKKLTLVKVAATQNLLFRKENNGNYIYNMVGYDNNMGKRERGQKDEYKYLSRIWITNIDGYLRSIAIALNYM